MDRERKGYSRGAVDAGAIPFAPHLLLPKGEGRQRTRAGTLYGYGVSSAAAMNSGSFEKTSRVAWQRSTRPGNLDVKIRYFSENFKEEIYKFELFCELHRRCGNCSHPNKVIARDPVAACGASHKGRPMPAPPIGMTIAARITL